MGEQKPQKAKRPHKMRPSGTNMADAMPATGLNLSIVKYPHLNDGGTPESQQISIHYQFTTRTAKSQT